jgi:cell division septum initiation protein DivIVA
MAGEEHALAEDHWALLNEAIRYKMRERGIDPSEVPQWLDLIREYWHLLQDVNAVTLYVKGEQLKEALAQKAAEDAASAALQTEIDELQAFIAANTPQT